MRIALAILFLCAAPLAAQTADVSVTVTAGPSPQTANALADPFQATNVTMTVTNNGPQAAANVVLTETFTRSDMSGSFQVLISGPCSPPSPTGVCTLGTLASGQSATLTSFSVTGWVTQNPTLLNVAATVTSSTSDPNPANNSAAATVTINQPVFGAGFPTNVLPLSTATASVSDVVGISWSFCGPNPPFTVTVPLPAGTTLDPSSSPSCQGTTTVTCGVDQLIFTECRAVNVNFRIGSGAALGAHTITATISTPYAIDPNLANNTASGALEIVPPVPALSPLGLLLLAAALSICGWAALRLR